MRSYKRTRAARLLLFILLLILLASTIWLLIQLGKIDNGRHQRKKFKRPDLIVHPFRGDEFEEICHQVNVTFSKSSNSSIIFLASFPASGNTWTRFLLEGITGIFTGSIYDDYRLAKKFQGELKNWMDGSTIIVKTHLTPDVTLKPLSGGYRNVSQILLLIRNPIDAVLSYFEYNSLKSHRGHLSAKKLEDNREKFAEFARTEIVGWVNMIKTWSSLSNVPIHIIHYENLQMNLESELWRVLDFLQLHSPGREVPVFCTSKYSEGNFHRSFREKISFPYNSHLLELYKQEICNVQQWLRSRNLSLMPLENYVKNWDLRYKIQSSDAFQLSC